MSAKQLPPWVHQELITIDKTHGLQRPFREKAGLNHSTFKRLVEKGNGRATVVLRVIDAIEAEKTPEEITAKRIRQIIDEHREAIISSLAASHYSDRFPDMLSAFLMRKDGNINRKDTAAEMGYSSPSNVNHAEEAIYNEMEINRAFRDVVYGIRAKLDKRG